MATLTQPRESGFKTNPDYKILFEPSPRRVRVKFNGEFIAAAQRARTVLAEGDRLEVLSPMQGG